MHTLDVVPNGLRMIPQDAFYFCERLSQMAWGNSIAVIDSFAFGGCALTELQFPATLRSVRMGSFGGYNQGRLRNVVFTAPVDTVEPEVFTTHRLNTLRFVNTVPPVSTTMATMPGYPADYGCLYLAQVDSILIPCAVLTHGWPTVIGVGLPTNIVRSATAWTTWRRRGSVYFPTLRPTG